MKIKRIELINFKRFTHLVLKGIPDTKLVLLIGTNGSGKSSIFDAFELANSSDRIDIEGDSDNKYRIYSDYYRKTYDEDEVIKIIINTADGEEYRSDGPHFPHALPVFNVNAFYGRTSFRQVPQLKKTSLGKVDVNFWLDSDRPRYFIDKDNRFENDIEKLTEKILQEIFTYRRSGEDVREAYINPINRAFANIFGTDKRANRLELIEIIPPLDGKIAQVNFRKGDSQIHYNYLSAGEKEIFNLLLNLLSRGELYQDTVYFFDEMDLHLSTKLQYNLLKEITENWIPENCQLWTASHSLGFIDYANDFEQGVILDFDDLNFDKPQTILPSTKNDYQVFELAVSKDFIDKVFQGRRIIFSENTDTPLYNDLSLENTFFFIANDKQDVFHKSANLKKEGLVDRDFLTDDEVQEIKETYPQLRILPYYSIENLLYHPDNLSEYYQTAGKPFDKEAYVAAIVKEKNQFFSDIVFGIGKARDGYPFFKENQNQAKLRRFKETGREIGNMLKSDEFETFYKIFPAKDYGKTIDARQNITRKELAKTKWFKDRVAEAVV